MVEDTQKHLAAGQNTAEIHRPNPPEAPADFKHGIGAAVNSFIRQQQTHFAKQWLATQPKTLRYPGSLQWRKAEATTLKRLPKTCGQADTQLTITIVEQPGIYSLNFCLFSIHRNTSSKQIKPHSAPNPSNFSSLSPIRINLMVALTGSLRIWEYQVVVVSKKSSNAARRSLV